MTWQVECIACDFCTFLLNTKTSKNLIGKTKIRDGATQLFQFFVGGAANE